ncbi:hypothetical protein [Alteribacter keqinensis]|uniref:Uncharacterized protein n=1 Tax=Alteribacter keqinensis TaxID=2483800 RepID=A0A3M7TUY7_9BACI|nr:hypothetical protein [Alteribacter keqinensis]RNA69377.1 hypothetical protein EBO34_05405 [Alteribacter keqinensis]
MFKSGDTVYVNKHGRSEYVGKGTVKEACKTPEELQRYFSETHPFFDTYTSWIQKGKTIYIVDLESNIGTAGFLEQELSHELIEV